VTVLSRSAGDCLLCVDGKQLERPSREPTVDQLAVHAGLPHSIAEACGCVRITMIVDTSAVNEIRIPVDSHGKVTAAARKPELALPARRLDD
jgi:hypothetical protein